MSARIVEPSVVLRREDPLHLAFREARQLAEPRELRDVEVETTRCLVRKSAPAQALRELDHCGYLARGMRDRVRLPPVKAFHVAQEGVLLAPAERAPADLVASGTLQDRLVNIGDVLRVPHAPPAGFEEAR